MQCIARPVITAGMHFFGWLLGPLKLSMRTHGLSVLFFLSIIPSQPSQASDCGKNYAQIARNARHIGETEIKLRARKKLKFMTLNIAGISFNIGQFYRDSHGHLIPDPKSMKHKSLEQIEASGSFIKRENPDIVTLIEVEDKAELEDFVKKYLDDSYNVFMKPGNDKRKSIAFLVKRDLPVMVETRSYANEIVQGKTYEGRPFRVFKRDFPALLFYTDIPHFQHLPLFILFGTHFVSQGHNDQARLLRDIEERRAVEIIRQTKREFGKKANIIVNGDLNWNIDEHFKLLHAEVEDPFDFLHLPKEEAWTHSFHLSDPKTGKVISNRYHRLDGFFVNWPLKPHVKSAHAVEHIDENGQALGRPQDIHERNKQFTDHRAVVAEIDLNTFLDDFLTPVSENKTK